MGRRAKVVGRSFLIRRHERRRSRISARPAVRAAVGAHFGRHQALRAGPEAHQHGLAGPQLGEAEAAQRLHVHEDVRRALAARQEAEAAQPVEPFHHGPLEPAGRRHRDVGARRRQLRRMDRRRLVHREDAEALQALRPLQHLADDARAFVGGLEAVAAQAGHVQQHVRHAVVGNDEAVALGDVEPFDDAGELDDGRRLVGEVAELGCGPSPSTFWPQFVRRHDAARCRLSCASYGRCRRICFIEDNIAPSCEKN